MNKGRFIVGALGDLVVVVQDGYFDTALMDRMIAAIEAATREATAPSGTCAHIADVRTLTGGSLLARVKFERFTRRLTTVVRRVAVVTSPGVAYHLVRSTGELIPGFRYRFVPGLGEALAALGRPAAELDALEKFVGSGPWVSEGSGGG